MNVLLSTIGSRGEVQPLLALAVALRARGHGATLCAPPNFQPWIESLGFACVPIGPDLRKLTASAASTSALVPTPAQRKQAGALMVKGELEVLSAVMRGFDLVVGGGALQIATRSVAESLGIPYVFAAYCPATFPNDVHPPLAHPAWRAPPLHVGPSERRRRTRLLWKQDARRFDDIFLTAVNEGRVARGLSPIARLRRHVLTERPWLCADPTLAPIAAGTRASVVETGALLLDDPTPLPPSLVRFLDAGEPPVYFGFGSMVGARETGDVLRSAARALGLRTIIARGWGELSVAEEGADTFTVDEVNHRALFPRVSVVVHHGGAGTTTAVAHAGKPQVIVPHIYDQFYFAERIARLGVGSVSPPRERFTRESMIAELRSALAPSTRARAEALAPRIVTNGAALSAEQLERVVTSARGA